LQEEADQVSYQYFIGFDVYDQDLLVGKIDAVNDQTDNVLFCVVTNNDDVVMIPAVEDFMMDIDHKNKVLYLDLPEGLLTIND
jgi:16S rRNA processing protein RimM